MAEEASVPEILKGVAADILADALKVDSADEYQVPKGQKPSQAVVVATGRPVCKDPGDQSAANGGILEAVPLARRSLSSRRSPSPPFSASRPGQGDRFHGKRQGAR